jgi:hypothetical protein
MKPLSLIAFVLALFLIFLGISSRQTSGALSYAVIVGGGLILVFLAAVWTIYFLKEKGEGTGKE